MLLTTTANAPGASVVTVPVEKLNVAPSVRRTPARLSEVLPVLVNSMNSKSSATKPGFTANSPAVGGAGWYMTSVIRKAWGCGPTAAPATNWAGSDQWLQRPLLSCIRTRAR